MNGCRNGARHVFHCSPAKACPELVQQPPIADMKDTRSMKKPTS
jgi:hypothetical protein